MIGPLPREHYIAVNQRNGRAPFTDTKRSPRHKVTLKKKKKQRAKNTFNILPFILKGEFKTAYRYTLRKVYTHAPDRVTWSMWSPMCGFWEVGN